MTRKNQDSRKAAIERDRKAALVIWRYLLFYGAVIVILSVCSYLLDIVFYTISYGSPSEIYYNPAQYIGYYMIAGYLIFPGSILYNYVINYMNPAYKWRLLAGMIIFLILGAIISIDFKFGYYIGEYRVLKNIFVLLLSGLSVEILRTWVVKERIKKQSMKNQSLQS